MKKILGNTAWVLGAYILLSIYHVMGVPYLLQFTLNTSAEREPSFAIDFLARPVGAGFAVAVLLGVVIALLRHSDAFCMQNVSAAPEALRRFWRGILKKLLLAFAAVACLTLVFDYFSGSLHVAVAEVIMRLTGMDHLDQVALLKGYDSIPFATMKISCGFAEAIVPNVFSLAELYLVYLAYQIMCLLFDGRAKAARAAAL